MNRERALKLVMVLVGLLFVAGHVFCVWVVANRIGILQELHAANLCVMGAVKNLDFGSPPIGYIDVRRSFDARNSGLTKRATNTSVAILNKQY